MLICFKCQNLTRVLIFTTKINKMGPIKIIRLTMLLRMNNQRAHLVCKFPLLIISTDNQNAYGINNSVIGGEHQYYGKKIIYLSFLMFIIYFQVVALSANQLLRKKKEYLKIERMIKREPFLNL
jgi:hypothetical protein